MQNRNYLTREEALNAPSGALELKTCPQCGFSFNSKFDPAALSYDENYDNSATSPVLISYYRKIATYLYGKYHLKDRWIVEIGCGKGVFLRIFTEMFPDARGLGIDPSYTGDASPRDNLVFVGDAFKKEYLPTRPGLIVARHVIEHIPSPVKLLMSIGDGLQGSAEIPCFFEVPDLWWILKNNAFWDFCYEHCNYFTPETFSNMLAASGYSATSIQTQFGGQYIWAEALTGKRTALKSNDLSALLRAVEDYSKSENEIINRAKASIELIRKTSRTIAVWGMATKGILFTYLLDPAGKSMDYCIDTSDSKHGRFAPLTGYPINPPSILQKTKGPLAVIIMNPIYATEIREALSEREGPITFTDAFGKSL
ncbi:MAG: class I SAM-dependent methyltransferase [Anaerolineales bacterium]